MVLLVSISWLFGLFVFLFVCFAQNDNSLSASRQTAVFLAPYNGRVCSNDVLKRMRYLHTTNITVTITTRELCCVYHVQYKAQHL